MSFQASRAVALAISALRRSGGSLCTTPPGTRLLTAPGYPAEGELADRLKELPKYVVSSTLTDPAWNATVLGDDWREEVARLRKELDGEILVYGSRRLSRALIEMGLVDELRLLVYPVVLREAALCMESSGAFG
jgi:dihydrofolate reductase